MMKRKEHPALLLLPNPIPQLLLPWASCPVPVCTHRHPTAGAAEPFCACSANTSAHLGHNYHCGKQIPPMALL